MISLGLERNAFCRLKYLNARHFFFGLFLRKSHQSSFASFTNRGESHGRSPSQATVRTAIHGFGGLIDRGEGEPNAASPYFSIAQVQSITCELPVYNAGCGRQSVGAVTQAAGRGPIAQVT
jgi:hypothetical protein